MSYRYEPSEKEARAAATLRKKGWTVTEPTCPLCHGNGWMSTTALEDWTPNGPYTWKTEPCPNGCQTSWFFYSSSTTLTTLTSEPRS